METVGAQLVKGLQVSFMLLSTNCIFFIINDVYGLSLLTNEVKFLEGNSSMLVLSHVNYCKPNHKASSTSGPALLKIFFPECIYLCC